MFRPYTMENRLRQAEGLVSSVVKPRFPLTTIDDAVGLIVDLLESDHEPQLAVIGILFHLIQTNLKLHEKGREKSADISLSISWETFNDLWNRFVGVFPRLRKTFGCSNKKKQTKKESIQVRIQSIYKYLGTFLRVDRAFRGAASGGGLVKFISAVSDPSDVGKKSGLSDLKFTALVIAQLLALDNVHFSLSEGLCFLRLGDKSEIPESAFAAVPDEEDGLLPIRSLPVIGPPIQTRDLWICSKKQFVHCDRFMEVAYLCCALDGNDFQKSGGPLGLFQHNVLAHFYHKGQLKMYPSAMAVYGFLKSLLAIDVAEAERILLEAIQINRNLFQNAYVAPYSLFFYHLYGQENKIAALLPAMLTSDVIKQYHYVVNLDRCLNDQLLKMASCMEHIIPKDPKASNGTDPVVAGLVIGFIDNICMWEEKSNTPIWHSTWSAKLIRCCLHKLACGPLQQVMLHGSMSSMETVVDPVTDYISDTLDSLRNSKAIRNGSLRSDETPISVLPDGLSITEDFCQFALELYETWPPMRLDFLSESFLHTEHFSMIGAVPKDEQKSVEFLKMLEEWPESPSVSDEDLRRIGQIRKVNPFYQKCSKHVFPFLDMGPANIPIACFDYEKIKRAVKAPLRGTPESRVIYELRQRLGKKRKRPDDAPVFFSHVLLKSQKMLNIRSLLGQEKFNQAEICLKLEGSAAGAVGGAKEKRERRPSAKICLK